MKNEYLAKERFISWLEKSKSEYIGTGTSFTNCPLVHFLKANFSGTFEVTENVFYLNSITAFYLPEWAKQFVASIDEKYKNGESIHRLDCLDAVRAIVIND